MMGIGMKIEKLVIFSSKRCYRSICNHLVLVGFLFFLAFLFRSTPFIFSMLVSASPVIVCTLALLSAWLNFAKPNIFEIESDKRETHPLVSLKAAYSDDGIVNDEEEKFSASGNDISKVSLDGSFGQLVDKISRGKELNDMEERQEDRRVVDNQYSLTEVDIDDQDNDDDSSIATVDSTEVNIDILDSLRGSPWKYVEQEEGFEDDGEAMGSGYDGAASSSPDTSMADITPILDELDPLLDEEPSQPANLSLDGSYASTELSLTSYDSSSVVDDDIDDHQELSAAEDDDEDDEVVEDQITWTEVDQKNLMDIRTSELERNRRLENLIATRRTPRSLSMVTERNLIDLDTTDSSFSGHPISTTRTDPFDLRQDSSEPIPGSAPSILLPRKHPSYILSESSEVKPNLMEGSFQQDFMPLLPKDPFFRSNDSNVQPSSFRMSRIEKHATSRFRRHFGLERLGSEGPSYSPIREQSSVVSDGTGEKASVIDVEYDIETPRADDMAHKEPVHDSSPSAASDLQSDSELDSSAMMLMVILWLLQNPQQSSVKETLTDAEQKPSQNDHEELPAFVEECVGEVNSGKQVAVSDAVSHAGVTNEDKLAINIPNEVGTSDAGSDEGESDVKEIMQNAGGDTTLEKKTSDSMMWVNQILVTRKKIV